MITRFFFLILAAATCCAAEPQSFDTSWITATPEVLTYRSTGKQGDGLYQVSVWRTADGIELYINIITPGFTKSVSGTMASDLHPRESKGRIVVDGQIIMTTDCTYKPGQLHIATLMIPCNRTVEDTLPLSKLVVDFSQIPLLPRTLPLKPGAEFKFDSLNPQSNALVPLTYRVIKEEMIHGAMCCKVEASDFEGQSTLWIEKSKPHRAMRIEQQGRVTELIPTPPGATAPQ
jgi:hypothetical protein